MSDLFGNHIVGFPTRRLIFELEVPTQLIFFSYLKNHDDNNVVDDSD